MASSPGGTIIACSSPANRPVREAATQAVNLLEAMPVRATER
jgi:hypothetical protein